MISTYFLIDIFSIVIPLIFSFHPKLRFDKSFRSFIPAMAVVAVVFIVWDIYFTEIGVWGFNPIHLQGWNV
ncbi:MAG: lycopene cyclase domain-containing protein, partial [Bacteroidia bacterium]|nr:lycopene cyclase domain-containing protein [Bacteroidia bacterium]